MKLKPKNILLILLIAAIALLLLRSVRTQSTVEEAEPVDVAKPIAADVSGFEVSPESQASMILQNTLTELCERLLKDFPDNIEVVFISAGFYWYANNSARALDVLDNGLTLDPDNPNLHDKKAQITFALGGYEKALLHWNKASEVMGDEERLYGNIAETLMYLGRYEDAAGTLEKRIGLTGQMPGKHYHLLGQAYFKLNDYAKAQQYLEKAISLGSVKTLNTYYLLAQTYMRLKQPEKAKGYLRLHKKWKEMTTAAKHQWDPTGDILVTDISTSVRLDQFPTFMSKLCLIGSELYRIDGKDPESESVIDVSEDAFVKVYDLVPNDAKVLREFASIYLTTGRGYAKAKELATQAILLDESAEGYFILSSAYYKNGDAQSAIAALEQAIALDPNNEIYRQVYFQITRAPKK